MCFNQAIAASANLTPITASDPCMNVDGCPGGYGQTGSGCTGGARVLGERTERLGRGQLADQSRVGSADDERCDGWCQRSRDHCSRIGSVVWFRVVHSAARPVDSLLGFLRTQDRRCGELDCSRCAKRGYLHLVPITVRLRCTQYDRDAQHRLVNDGRRPGHAHRRARCAAVFQRRHLRYRSDDPELTCSRVSRPGE